MFGEKLINFIKNEVENESEKPRYSCNNHYKCHRSIKGNYYTLDDCNKHCYPKYKCHTNADGTTECIIAHDGKYKSVKECQEKCKSKYICDRDEKNQPSCKISANGNFNSLTECQTKCQPLFACNPISNTCHYSAKGTYTSVENCQIGCLPKNYTCDKKSYTCIPQPTPPPIDCAANFGSTTPSDGTLGTVSAKYVCPESLPVCKDYQYNKKWGNCVAAPSTAHSGPYSTIEECSEQCQPPILLPKENINKNTLNKQLQVKSTMDGSLESEKLRYNSKVLEYLTYIVITITIIGLICYYAINNTNTTLGTVIAIVSAILVIFIIAKYIYEHYNFNTRAFRVQ